MLSVRLRNSFLVSGLSWKPPNMTLVTVLAFIFCTPRITIHMWLKYIEGKKSKLLHIPQSLINEKWKQGYKSVSVFSHLLCIENEQRDRVLLEKM